jgi:hypothetical protein
LFTSSLFNFDRWSESKNVSIFSRFSCLFECRFWRYYLMIFCISLVFFVIPLFISILLVCIFSLLLVRFCKGLSILLYLFQHFDSLILCVVFFEGGMYFIDFYTNLYYFFSSADFWFGLFLFFLDLRLHHRYVKWSFFLFLLLSFLPSFLSFLSCRLSQL